MVVVVATVDGGDNGRITPMFLHSIYGFAPSVNMLSCPWARWIREWGLIVLIFHKSLNTTRDFIGKV